MNRVHVSDIVQLSYEKVGRCVGAVRMVLERVYGPLPEWVLPNHDDADSYREMLSDARRRSDSSCWHAIDDAEKVGDVMYFPKGETHVAVVVDEIDLRALSATADDGVHVARVDRFPSHRYVYRINPCVIPSVSA